MDDRSGSAESPGSVRVARWAGTLGVILPAVGIIVYPILSFPTTHASGVDVETMTTTAIATYAYDQIDQARTELEHPS